MTRLRTGTRLRTLPPIVRIMPLDTAPLDSLIRLIRAIRGFTSNLLLRRSIACLALGFTLILTGLEGDSLATDSCADNLTPQTVILDHFEAREATVADVLEALVLVTEKATRRAYRPNLIVIGDAIGQMKLSLKLTKAPLSDALDRIGELPGVQVTYRSNQTVIFSTKDG